MALKQSTKTNNNIISIMLYSLSTIMSTTIYATPMIHDYSGQKTHKLNFGGNGIDTLLIIPPKTCATLQFSTVQINLTKKRYAKARIIDQPKKGCQQQCVIKVKWTHKPAGIIAYNLHVTWEKIHNTCK